MTHDRNAGPLLLPLHRSRFWRAVLCRKPKPHLLLRLWCSFSATSLGILAAVALFYLSPILLILWPFIVLDVPGIALSSGFIWPLRILIGVGAVSLFLPFLVSNRKTFRIAFALGFGAFLSVAAVQTAVREAAFSKMLGQTEMTVIHVSSFYKSARNVLSLATNWYSRAHAMGCKDAQMYFWSYRANNWVLSVPEEDRNGRDLSHLCAD